MKVKLKIIRKVKKKKLNVSGIVLMRNFKRRSLHSCQLTQTKNEQELSLCCNVEYIDRKEDSLTLWKRNKNSYPTMAQIAREYLTIPAMSTLSRRIFSTAGYISSKRISR